MILILGKVLKRPVYFPSLPLLRLGFGDMADELLLAGQKASPVRLLEHGFVFRHPPFLDSALHDAAARQRYQLSIKRDFFPSGIVAPFREGSLSGGNL